MCASTIQTACGYMARDSWRTAKQDPYRRRTAGPARLSGVRLLLGCVLRSHFPHISLGLSRFSRSLSSLAPLTSLILLLFVSAALWAREVWKRLQLGEALGADDRLFKAIEHKDSLSALGMSFAERGFKGRGLAAQERRREVCAAADLVRRVSFLSHFSRSLSLLAFSLFACFSHF